MIDQNLICDVGMHKGEDSDYYLKKGFRVVAVEANPALCEECAQRFESEIASGQLSIDNCAIAEAKASIEFYINASILNNSQLVDFVL